jgi:alpha-beta hydrolase superfamily lysophospholipase
MRFLIHFATRAVFALIIVIVTIVLIRAFDARKLPELRVWHTVEPESEYRARRDGDIDGFAAYLAQEQRVFDELDETIYSAVPTDQQSAPSRYTQDSRFNSQNHATNWNRTVELIPETPTGGVLMLHGLTDSPYSMRSTAELFHAKGFYVLVLRLPGHGTVPEALRHARSEDWQAVIEPAARHVRSVIDDEQPFFIVGYSNGGALAVNYALDALNDDSLPLPNRLVLMSPAIGIPPYAMFANWHKSLSWLPYFEKFRWQAVLPEYDPYKYNSFPKSAGHETYALTQQVQEKLSRFGAPQTARRYPPVLAFVPLVDATVSTSATVQHLFQQLNRPEDELVLYDINRFGRIHQFLKSEHQALLQNVWDDPGRRFGLTLVTNRTPASGTVLARTSLSGRVAERLLAGEWPPLVYSLSHVAIPIPPDDAWYGDGSSNRGEQFSLGTLTPRGEKQVLIVPAELLLRLRHNPFFDYQASRVDEAIEEPLP